jgi:hypothetical protein
MQIFNTFNSRRLTNVNIFDKLCVNKLFWLVIIVEIAIHLLFVCLGGNITNCSLLSMKDQFICIAIASSELIIGILAKLLPLEKVGLFNRF